MGWVALCVEAKAGGDVWVLEEGGAGGEPGGIGGGRLVGGVGCEVNAGMKDGRVGVVGDNLTLGSAVKDLSALLARS